MIFLQEYTCVEIIVYNQPLNYLRKIYIGYDKILKFAFD